MREQLLQSIGNSRQEYRFLRTRFATSADASRTVVVDQVAKHWLDCAFARAVCGAGSAVNRIVRGTGKLLTLIGGHTRRLERTVVAVLVGWPINL